MSPFAERAIKYRKHYIGGKSDDITVVVAQIKLLANKYSNTKIYKNQLGVRTFITTEPLIAMWEREGVR